MALKHKVRKNIDRETVDHFGQEWTRFDQGEMSEDDLREEFNQYFKLFPWKQLPKDAAGFDMGCGSGRWAKFVAPRVGKLYCIDASSMALEVAKGNLKGETNCQFMLASVDNIPVEDQSMDFGYSLGVLHHTPDPAAALESCARKLKTEAPFLVYMYYAFDNRPSWFRLVWRASDVGRGLISRLPFSIKYPVTQLIAAFVYLPMSRLAALLESLGFDVSNFPLSAYRHRSFYLMRNDALDRFGTKIEKRFTKTEIAEMMRAAGLERIKFQEDGVGFWKALGFKK